jgi:putative transposase
VRPAQRRAAAAWRREAFGFAERRACRLVGMGRSTARYRPHPPPDEAAVRQRLRDLAAERPRFGYRRLHALRRRDGIALNHKRVARLYRAEGLAVRKRPRKRVAAEGRGRAAKPSRPNQQWGLDFVGDALGSGRRIRVLGVLDLFTREALALEVDVSLPAARVAQVLERLVGERGSPEEIVLDNGPELAGRVLDRWAAGRAVRLRFIAPGKPQQNAFVESFNGRFREECLDRHWFADLADARGIIERWRVDDDRARPHSALGYRTPDEARQAFGETTTTTTTTNEPDEQRGLP